MNFNTKTAVCFIILLTLLIGGFPTLNIHAEKPGQTTNPYLSLIQSNRNEIQLKIEVDDFDITEEKINNISYHHISLTDCGYTTKRGHPQLPVIRFFIAVPPDTSSVSLDSLNKDSKIIDGFNIYPVQMPVPENNQSKNNLLINETIYNSDNFFPQQTYSYTKGWLRDYQFIHIEIFPITYNAFQQKIKLQEDIRLNLKLEYEKNISETKTRKGFTTIYENTFINYDSAKEWYQHTVNRTLNKKDQTNLLDPSNQARLLIISNDSFTNSLQSFIKWKHDKGWNVFTTNTTQVYSQFSAFQDYESIKDFILYTYNNWTVSPSHVILIGDVEYVPTYYYQGSTPSDHYYTCLSGSDYLSDISIGRISVKNTNELTDIINKIIPYEKNPYLNETTWYKKAMLVSDSGYFETTSDWVNQFLGGFNYTLDKFYASYGTATNTNIKNALNEGRAIANYRGHGATTGWATGSFYNSDILQLTNGRKLPLVISPTCSTGHYDDPSTDCYGETWLKAADKGGISFWGSSRVSYGGYNDELDMGIYKAIFNDEIFDFGGITNKAKLYMYNEYGSSDYTCLLELHLFNIIGDPTLDPWTEIPQNLTVYHPTSILPDSSDFPVEVLDNNSAVEEALVCINNDGDLYQYGLTNSTGKIVFNVTTNMFGNVNVTVTKHNFKPYQTTILIPAESPLKQGWNFISTPANHPVGTNNIMIKHNNSYYNWSEATTTQNPTNTQLIDANFFGWNKTEQTYELTTTLHPGEGYWMYCFKTSEMLMQCMKTPPAVNITNLQDKWNIISHPAATSITKTNLSIDHNGTLYNWSHAVQQNIIDANLYGWNRINQTYDLQSILKPTEAYWMYSYNDCTVKKMTNTRPQ